MFPETRSELVPYLRQHWRALLLLLVGILLPLLLVMDLTDEVFREGGFAWDQSILEWYKAHRTPTLTKLAQGISFVGGLAVLPVLTLAIALLLARFQAKAHGWFLVLAVTGATVLNVLAKLIFQRPRPDQLVAMLSEPGFSFPSGHAMSNAAFGIALVFIFWRSKYFWPVSVLGLLWAVAVGASRNYLGVHYPTDVLVGFLSSLIWVSGLRFLMRRRWPMLDEAPQPQLSLAPEKTKLNG